MKDHDTTQAPPDRSRPVKVDEDLVLQLNFVPAWARKPPSAGQLAIYDDRHSGSGLRDRPNRRDQRDTRRDRDSASGRRPAPPRRERGAEGREQRGAAPPAVERREYPTRRVDAPVGADDRQRTRPAQDVPLPPVSVRFLPEHGPLNAVIQRIRSSRRAYPLMDLAALLLNQEGACYVKIEVDRDADQIHLYQCKHCRHVTLDPETLKMHILQAHFDVWFSAESVACDPPGGTFVCVARCGLSGTLLGPPNHHLFNEMAREVHATRYPNMDFEDYKAKLEMSHENADIEAWRTAAAHRTLYRLKTRDDGPALDPLSRHAAESYARDHLIEAVIMRTRKAGVPEAVARGITDRGLLRAIRESWRREHRFPLQLSLVLRAALRRRNLFFFKAGKGVQFVSVIQPAPLDPTYTIESIGAVLTYLREHPGCSREQLVEALCPHEDIDSDAGRELLKPLYWLIDRGHIIEFFNGKLSVPLMPAAG